VFGIGVVPRLDDASYFRVTKPSQTPAREGISLNPQDSGFVSHQTHDPSGRPGSVTIIGFVERCDAADSAKQARDELSTMEAKRLLDDLAKWGIRLLIFDGGEPLCRDDFFDIVRYAMEKGMRTVVGSNGIRFCTVPKRAAKNAEC
jgi:pyruvate-formate lyase-activating enzyme